MAEWRDGQKHQVGEGGRGRAAPHIVGGVRCGSGQCDVKAVASIAGCEALGAFGWVMEWARCPTPRHRTRQRRRRHQVQRRCAPPGLCSSWGFAHNLGHSIMGIAALPGCRESCVSRSTLLSGRTTAQAPTMYAHRRTPLHPRTCHRARRSSANVESIRIYAIESEAACMRAAVPQGGGCGVERSHVLFF